MDAPPPDDDLPPPDDDCPLCGRGMGAPEDRAAAANNPLVCDRGGAAAHYRRGALLAPAVPRCPYKE